FEGSQNLPDFSYAQFANMLGLQGIEVDDPEEISDAWDRALSADRPVVLDVKTDPDVPPLPPHINFKQAKHFMQTLVKGDPDEAGMIRQTFKDALAGVTGSSEE